MHAGDPDLQQILDFISQNKEIIIVLSCFLLVGFSVLVKAIASIFHSFSRERTRREIAAYIAEGSMSPDQGERLMKADDGSGPKRCA